jgi:hypothetical protein
MALFSSNVKGTNGRTVVIRDNIEAYSENLCYVRLVRNNFKKKQSEHIPQAAWKFLASEVP